LTGYKKYFLTEVLKLPYNIISNLGE